MGRDDITEKSLLEIWSKTFPKLPHNRFNTWAALSGFLLLLIPLIFGPIPEFKNLMLPFVELLATVYGSLLGFIIAGYAIFTSASNPKFILQIWKHVDSKSQLPLLKLHLLVYVRLFLSLFLSLGCVVVMALTLRIWPFITLHVSISERLRLALQCISMALIGWSITNSSVQIKAMIFNLYNLILTQVRFLEIDDKNSTK